MGCGRSSGGNQLHSPSASRKTPHPWCSRPPKRWAPCWPAISESEAQSLSPSPSVQLANWEEVSFQGQQARMEKAKEIRPPTQISPANVAHTFSTGEGTKHGEDAGT